MRAEVISIGDELASGQRLDTNSQWLSQRLGELGVRVTHHTTVADDLQANIEVFRAAAERVELVIATGGLGPTADDLTREALAAAAGVELELDEPSLAQIRALFARRGREMPERNVSQAMFPRGATPIPNPHGSAPGVDLTLARRGGEGAARVFALPGVPAEMREMWQATVAPAVESLLAQRPGERRCIRHRLIKCFGVGESDLEQMLPDLIRRGRVPTVGITVHKATISLRITAEADSPDACAALIAPTERTIRDCLGDLVYGEEHDELQDAVVRRLREQQWRLAVFEWGTGGLITDWLATTEPEGTHFLGGEVLRSAGAATELAAGAEFAPTTDWITNKARQVRDRFGVDCGLAVGPFPNFDDPEGRVLLACVTPLGTVAKSVRFAGHPDIQRERCAKQALDLLRLVGR